MAYEVLCSVEDRIATVTLNRPEKRNALNTVVLRGLAAMFDQLDKNPDVRVVVVRGEGRAFCSGMDLGEMAERQAQNADPEADVTRVFQIIERSRHPSIAMINGDAYAGGCELALHCDLRVVAEHARFAMPLARIGLIVPFVLGQKLVEIVGPAFTREMLFTGRPVSAARAYEVGMVHRVVPLGELEKATYELARAIADNAPTSLAGMKQVLLRAVSARERVEQADLDEMARAARKGPDAMEGVRAVLEKRKPNFPGAGG